MYNPVQLYTNYLQPQRLSHETKPFHIEERAKTPQHRRTIQTSTIGFIIATRWFKVTADFKTGSM